jgi:hypothetical protein
VSLFKNPFSLLFPWANASLRLYPGLQYTPAHNLAISTVVSSRTSPFLDFALLIIYDGWHVLMAGWVLCAMAVHRRRWTVDIAPGWSDSVSASLVAPTGLLDELNSIEWFDCCRNERKDLLQSINSFLLSFFRLRQETFSISGTSCQNDKLLRKVVHYHLPVWSPFHTLIKLIESLSITFPSLFVCLISRL